MAYGNNGLKVILGKTKVMVSGSTTNYDLCMIKVDHFRIGGLVVKINSVLHVKCA